MKNIFLIITLFQCVLYPQSIDNTNLNPDPNEIISIIVSFKDKPIVEQTKGLSKTNNAQSIHMALSNQHQEFLANLRTKSSQLNQLDKSLISNQIQITQEYFMSVNGIALKIPRYLFSEISKMPNVKSVFLDKVIPLDNSPIQDNPSTMSDGFKESNTSYTGKGVRIAIFDTGINWRHPALGGGVGPNFKIIYAKDFVKNQLNPTDYYGHGTFVAGIAAGNSSSFKGVAPDANLLDIKTYDDALGGNTWSAIVAGLEYCLDPNGDFSTEDHVEIVNMSFGGGTSGSDNPYNEALKNAVLSGITIIAAAGNDGPDYFTVTDPGRFIDIITVGNWDTQNNQINTSSSRGPILPTLRIKPDVVASGTNIVSCDLDTGYTINGGTSASTPYVSGIAALLKEKNKNLDPYTICSIISQSSIDEKLNNWTQGFGLVNIDMALNRMTTVYPTSFGTTVEINDKILFDTLYVSNLSNAQKTYNVEISGSLPSGINLTALKTNFVLDAGEITTVIIKSEIHPLNIPLLPTKLSDYSASIKFISNIDTTDIKYFCYRGTILRVNTPSGLPVFNIQNETNCYFSESFFRETIPTYKIDYIYISSPGDYDMVGNVQGINWHLDPELNSYKYDNGYFVFPKIHLEGYTEITLDSSIYVYKIENKFYKLGGSIYGNCGWHAIGNLKTNKGVAGTNFAVNYFLTDIPLTYFFEYQLITKDYQSKEYKFANNYFEGVSSSSTVQFDESTLNQISITYFLSNSISSVWSVTKNRAGLYDLGQPPYNPTLDRPFRETIYFSPVPNKNEGQNWLCGINQPYLKNILYNKISSIFNGDNLSIREKPLLESAYYVQQDKDTLTFLEDKIPTYNGNDYNALFKITSSNIEYILGPPHFYGKINFSNNQLSIAYLNQNTSKEINDQFFHYQYHDISNYKNIYAYFIKNQQAVDSLLISSSDSKLNGEINYPNSLSGIVNIEIPFYDYEVYGAPGAARINFTLNSSAIDKVPPYIPFFQIYDGINIVNKTNKIENIVIKFQAYDDIGLKNVVASFKDSRNIWYALQVSAYSANNYLATFPNGVQEGFISVKFTATDQTDNICEYTCEPFLYYNTSLNDLTQPVNIKPQNNITAVPFLNTSFQWSLNENASLYYLQISKSATFDSLAYSDSTISISSTTVKSLEKGTKYYWRVRAKNIYGSSPWSEVWSFTTKLATSILTAPPNNSTVISFTPTLSWSAVSGADKYKLEVNTKSDFTGTVIYDQDTVSTTSRQIGGLANNTSYFWRVTGLNNDGNSSDTSTTFKFTTTTANGIDALKDIIPTKYEVFQNYPNPFNPSSTIRYALPFESKVTIKAYNLLGQEIKTLLNAIETAGYHEVTFSVNNLASGIYLYRITANSIDGKKEFIDTKKLILLK